MNAPLQVGLIGAGRWARAYVKTIAAAPDLRLAWIARSRNDPPDFLPEACRFTTDWRGAVSDPSTQGVIIATPPQAHAQMAEFAMRAGKAVLIEKPLTLDLAQAEQLLRTARETRAFAMVEHTHLFNPAFRELKKRLPTIGSVDAVHGLAGNWGPFRKDVPVLWDWGAHDVAMFLDVFGTLPSSIDVQCTASESQPDGQGAMYRLQFDGPGGTPVRLEFGNLLENKARRYTVYGSKATLVYDDLAKAKLQIFPQATPFEPPVDGTEIDIEPAPPLAVAVREFAAGIAAGSRDHGSLTLGVEVVRVLDLCRRALN